MFTSSRIRWQNLARDRVSNNAKKRHIIQNEQFENGVKIDLRRIFDEKSTVLTTVGRKSHLDHDVCLPQLSRNLGASQHSALRV
jgi:hypothetical protein